MARQFVTNNVWINSGLVSNIETYVLAVLINKSSTEVFKIKKIFATLFPLDNTSGYSLIAELKKIEAANQNIPIASSNVIAKGVNNKLPLNFINGCGGYNHYDGNQTILRRSVIATGYAPAYTIQCQYLWQFPEYCEIYNNFDDSTQPITLRQNEGIILYHNTVNSGSSKVNTFIEFEI